MGGGLWGGITSHSWDKLTLPFCSNVKVCGGRGGGSGGEMWEVASAAAAAVSQQQQQQRQETHLFM